MHAGILGVGLQEFKVVNKPNGLSIQPTHNHLVHKHTMSDFLSWSLHPEAPLHSEQLPPAVAVSGVRTVRHSGHSVGLRIHFTSLSLQYVAKSQPLRSSVSEDFPHCSVLLAPRREPLRSGARGTPDRGSSHPSGLFPPSLRGPGTLCLTLALVANSSRDCSHLPEAPLV